MDDYDKYDNDGLKSSSRTRDKNEKSRMRRHKSDKDRSPGHSHRYISLKKDSFQTFNCFKTTTLFT